MHQRHQEIIELNADLLRVVFDSLCFITDERIFITRRVEEAESLVDREDWYNTIQQCREVFRSIANERTDLK